MTLIIKNGQRAKYSSSELNFIPSFPVYAHENDQRIVRNATQFTVLNETQNIYIELANLAQDLDLYLADSRNVERANDGYLIKRSLASSTNWGTRNELIFAQLPPGEYFLDIRKNPFAVSSPIGNTPGDGEAEFELIFDSKKFDSKNAKLPDDTLLNKQWYLFNGGMLSFIDNPELIPKININQDTDAILPNADIRAPEAWKINHSAKDIVVAVVDTGVDIDHPDLKNNLWKNKLEIPGNLKDDDKNGYVDDVNGWRFYDNSNDPRPFDPSQAHGTHVAGTIGAKGNNGIGVTGVAWDVQLMPINISNPASGLTDPGQGLIYAVKNGADIINMSFGSSEKIDPAVVMPFMTSKGALTDDIPEIYKELLEESYSIFTELKKADVLSVIAAGNSGGYNSMISGKWNQVGNLDNSMSPYNFMGSFFDNSITVSAFDGMMNLSPYTNKGLTVDLAAPGGNINNGISLGILSTFPKGGVEAKPEQGLLVLEAGHGQVDYGYMQGTSMAAPVVSGGAALIKSMNPTLKSADIRNILMASASRNTNIENLAGENGLQLNLERALHIAKNWKNNRSIYTIEKGTKRDDFLQSGREPTLFRGQKGNDTIIGNQNNDQLFGNSGNDILTPGKGVDTVKGGRGKDLIVYSDYEESPIVRPDRVSIQADDRLDLSAMDGDHTKPGRQSLVLIDTPTFTGKSGELLARSNGVFADLNGDAVADFGLLFTKPIQFELSQENFVL